MTLDNMIQTVSVTFNVESKQKVCSIRILYIGIATNAQYMKIYDSIHIHCQYELTAYLNNVYFTKVRKSPLGP